MAGESFLFFPLFAQPYTGAPAPAASSAQANADAMNLLITDKAPDADLSSPPPIVGLLNTPWINGATFSTGDNAIPSSVNSPTPPAAESTGGASGMWGNSFAEGESGGIPDTIESWLLGGYSPAQLQSQGAALDAQLVALNQEARDRGTISEATYQKTVEHLATQIASTHDIPADINSGYVEGALAGYRADLAVLESIPKYAGRVTGDVLGAVLSGTGSGIGSILGAIPWWLWLGGVALLFVHLGGGKAVEYQARKRIARYAR